MRILFMHHSCIKLLLMHQISQLLMIGLHSVHCDNEAINHNTTGGQYDVQQIISER